MRSIRRSRYLEPQRIRTRPGGRMGRILVVDDEPRICTLVSRALERDGHTVMTAGTGAEALQLAIDQEFGLVVLDLMLPAIDGFKVLRRLLVDRPDQRVLIL